MDLTTIIPVEREVETPAAPPSLQMAILTHHRGSGDGSVPAEMEALFRPTLGQGSSERYATRADLPNLIEHVHMVWRDMPAVPSDAGSVRHGDVECPAGDPARPLATASRIAALYAPLVLQPEGHLQRPAVEQAFAVLLEAINTGLERVSAQERAGLLETAGVQTYPLPTIERLCPAQIGVLLTPWAEKGEW